MSTQMMCPLLFDTPLPSAITMLRPPSLFSPTLSFYEVEQKRGVLEPALGTRVYGRGSGGVVCRRSRVEV